MKICIVNTFYPPWRGGAETHVYNLSLNLSKLGHDIFVICADDPLKPGVYNYNGIRVKRLKDFGWLYGVPLIPSLFKELLDIDVDLIHANFPNPFNASLSAASSFIQNTPSVLTWHNDLPYLTKMAGLLAFTHDYFFSPIYLNFFDRIIATSKRYISTSKILLKNIKKLRVIPNGVNCELFNPHVRGDRIIDTYDLHDNIVILFVGALTKWHKYKGLDFLIQAFKLLNKKIKNAKLMVVGEGSLRRYYESYASSFNIEKDVIFTGDVKDRELPKFYAASDMVVLPSLDRSEGFGLTLLEGNATGKPIVGSNVGGIPEVIRDNFNGILVPPGDAISLAKSMENLCKDKKLRAKLGNNGRKFAEKLDWGIITKKTENLYLEVLK